MDLLTTNLHSSSVFLSRGGESNRIHWSESRILFESTGALTVFSSLLGKKETNTKITFENISLRGQVERDKTGKIVRNLSSLEQGKKKMKHQIVFDFILRCVLQLIVPVVRLDSSDISVFLQLISLVLIYGALANSTWRPFFFTCEQFGETEEKKWILFL